MPGSMPMALRVASVLTVGLVVLGCSDQDPSPDPDVTPSDTPSGEPDEPDDAPSGDASPEPRPPTALLVVGEPSLEGSDREVRAALEEDGFEVEVAADEAIDDGSAGSQDLVVVSKSVDSEVVADQLRRTDAGVLFWEDNAQAIEQGGEEVDEPGGGTPGLATIDVTNPEHTAWHGSETEVYVDPDAPEELRGGLSGEIDVYREEAEMTFAPPSGDGSTLPSSAIGVAEFGGEGSSRYFYYAIEAHAGLADGSGSHGRRVYFGLYDDTFELLTEDGLTLFGAAVEWAAGG